MNAESVVLAAYGTDPLETLAALMLDRHRRELPDLSRHAALLPSVGVIARFRRLLLAQARARGYAGVLAPWCGTLEQWLQPWTEDAAAIDEPERDLLLLEALASHPPLRERYGTWALVDSLLSLFDELNADRPAVPTDADGLAAELAAGYGVGAPLAPLQAEAQLVYTLWSTWNTQLRALRLHDRALRRRMALARARPVPDGAGHLYIVGLAEISGAEADWLMALQARNRATVLLHGGTRAGAYHPDAPLRRCREALGAAPTPAPAAPTPYARFLEAVFADDTDIGARARAFAADVSSSPVQERLRVFPAVDFEQEARAVDLAVRRWYAQGVTAIGIVTPDRKLARRVRALLERANIGLRDAAGWALSTTSAATAAMRWIECVEQDFAQAPLLDFLKSPFATFGFTNKEREAIVHCFEERLVRRYNITGGLDRYRRSLGTPLSSPQHAAGDPAAEPAPASADAAHQAALATLFDRLARAAEPLMRLLGSRPRSPFDYLAGLQASLERTGLVAELSADAAGNQLLAVLRPARGSARLRSACLSWAEFRHWLQRELERRRFRPPLPETGVELLDLAQSRCHRFDALIIAGCTRDQLPGAPSGSPFFNDGVRARLGLPTRLDRLLVPLHDFRRLLEAAPRVLLTWRRRENGEEAIPSPWVERLAAFHRLAYGSVPEDRELRGLLGVEATTLYRRDGAPLPEPAHMPAPQLPAGRVPAVLTTGAHQRLLDCPYQFYVADGLGLRRVDDVREEMEKSDYGRAVHRILHAFHTGVAGLPGPWSGGPIGPANRAAAAKLLRELGHRVFAYDADKRLSARGWRQRWERFVAAYLDWQERRARDWEIDATEKTLEREITVAGRALKLRGRVDRVDRGPAGLAVVDYKTGAVDDAAAVTAGEKTQLPFYALLCDEPVTEVMYAQFTPEAVKTAARIAGEELANLTRRLEKRLRTVIENIDRGARLPAWGDPETCRFCPYEGICRKEMWDVE